MKLPDFAVDKASIQILSESVTKASLMAASQVKDIGVSEKGSSISSVGLDEEDADMVLLKKPRGGPRQNGKDNRPKRNQKNNKQEQNKKNFRKRK
jgi:hypothetical protein